MKHTKSLLMAALAALSIASVGSASAEVIYITGSTAFRSSANTAISNFAAGNGGGILAIDNATLGSAGNLLLNYTNAGGTNLIDVHWSGSEAGVQSVAGPTNSNAAKIGFFLTNATGTNSGSSASAAATNYQAANITFADTFQSTSVFKGNFGGVTYATLSDSKVGIVSFNWVASALCPAANIQPNTAQQLLAAGTIPVAMLTGNTSDKTNGVYLLGRNVDSGTRLSTLSESGYGVKTSVTQYAVATNYTYTTNTTSGFTNITASFQGASATNSLIAYPVETINGVSSGTAGNSGYSSGGTLCGFMTNVYAAGSALTYVDNTGSTNNSLYTGSNFLIGYAGTSDANGKTNATANISLVKLNYGGVVCSTNAIAIGQYDFWGYEHLMTRSSGITTNVSAVASALVTALTNPAVSPTSVLAPNVNLSDMLVGRQVDGGPVYNNY